MKKLALVLILFSMSSCYISDWMTDPNYRKYPSGGYNAMHMGPFDSNVMPSTVMMESYLETKKDTI